MTPGSRRLWLGETPWEFVVWQNKILCEEKLAHHGPSSDGYGLTKDFWNENFQSEFYLFELIEFFRECHLKAPFTNYNGNTFSAIARKIIEIAGFEALQLVSARSLAGHIVAGVAGEKEMDALKKLCEQKNRRGTEEKVGAQSENLIGSVSENLPILHVSIADQTLALTRDSQTLFTAAVSTAANGIGFTEGSFQTPTGNFLVREKIGEGAPPGTVFKGRRPVGRWQPGDPDPVTTRILRLDGLDPENANTFQRYIYIHGTPAEDLLGTPASHGCVRLSDAHMLTLFDLVPLLTGVEIH